MSDIYIYRKADNHNKVLFSILRLIGNMCIYMLPRAYADCNQSLNCSAIKTGGVTDQKSIFVQVMSQITER